MAEVATTCTKEGAGELFDGLREALELEAAAYEAKLAEMSGEELDEEDYRGCIHCTTRACQQTGSADEAWELICSGALRAEHDRDHRAVIIDGSTVHQFQGVPIWVESPYVASLDGVIDYLRERGRFLAEEPRSHEDVSVWRRVVSGRQAQAEGIAVLR